MGSQVFLDVGFEVEVPVLGDLKPRLVDELREHVSLNLGHIELGSVHNEKRVVNLLKIVPIIFYAESWNVKLIKIYMI